MLKLIGSLRFQRIVQVLIGIFILLWLTHVLFLRGTHVPAALPSLRDTDRPRHPIDDLREHAQKDLNDLISRQSYTVEAAEHAYLGRRGRRPPPGFDKWFRYAQDHNAIIVEDFFDRIYDDLNPFWAKSPLEIRQQASEWFFRISVRNGNVTTRMDDERPWLNLWAHVIGNVAEHLPDLDIAINEMDESRIVVPWETINSYIEKEAKSRRILAADEMVREYNKTAINKEAETVPPIDWRLSSEPPYWNHAVRGCAPNSPARDGYVPTTDFTPAPPLSATRPERSFQGYVQNWTYSKSPCDNPVLQGLHGTFVEPISISTTDTLFPMFGGSKLPFNNEILLPAAMYWTDDPFYSGGAGHGGPWTEKQNKVIWRGAASGGRNRQENWARFQRHRFVAMMNATTVGKVERQELLPPNFVLPAQDAYALSTTEGKGLGAWLKDVADAAFVHLLCFPDTNPPFCPYTDPWYTVEKSMPMADQYNYKYLPDIDGNSFSGRYRGFLGSTSLPIKATIYDEWHDSRLMPWAHFVPMDNTFIDIYGILEYFIGTDSKAGHDDVAKSIASEGKSWAEKALRKEDMVIYVFRLLLEYARLCDDNRDQLGWSSD
ncbi:hypothetical protein CAC42_1886 [Sphaceloma murrayae]|uniref:Glycosyl transferase CAP10 domain-containing protein n=1 Tax=Sphaceloma murrayae TaxID=2082308 RepID=A0A2K1QW26_9PEZI|nr:hypothetical protein CAC42_1886 [Sphaceloma murrayae]